MRGSLYPLVFFGLMTASTSFGQAQALESASSELSDRKEITSKSCDLLISPRIFATNESADPQPLPFGQVSVNELGSLSGKPAIDKLVNIARGKGYNPISLTNPELAARTEINLNESSEGTLLLGTITKCNRSFPIMSPSSVTCLSYADFLQKDSNSENVFNLLDSFEPTYDGYTVSVNGPDLTIIAQSLKTIFVRLPVCRKSI